MFKHFTVLFFSLGLTLGFSPEVQAQDCSRPGTCRGDRVNPYPGYPGGVNPAPRPNRPPAYPGRVDPSPRPNRPPANPGRVNPRPIPNRPPAPPTRVNPYPNRPTNPGRVNPAPVPNRPTNPGRVNPAPRPPVNPGTSYRAPVRPMRPAPARRATDYRSETRWDYGRAHTNHNRYRHHDNWHRPNVRYTRVYHTPYYSVPRHNMVYYTPRDYYYHLSYRDIYWNQWIRVRINYNDGYHWYNNYPYFVYNGYRHRYSPVEYCDYELVDGYNNNTHTAFHGQSCQSAYDRCANLRDDLNYYAGDYRYFCSERFFDDPFSYDHWDFYDDFYTGAYAY